MWQGDDYLKELEKKLSENLEKAAIHLVNSIKTNINRSQPYTISAGEKGRWYKGEDPSAPGEFPKKIRGDLQRSISYEMGKDSAKVGSNLDYALFLELGTSKMAPRPFLRATFIQEYQKISDIITAT